MEDQVDKLLGQWARERPELDCSSLSVVVRVQFLAKLCQKEAERALAGLGLRLWEYDVLSALRRQGAPFQLPATALARASMLTSGAMTNRIDRLEARGLVLRATEPSDRRGVNVRLTERGHQLIDQAIGARLTAADSQLGALSGQERRAASAALRKVLLAAGRGSRPRP
ncbi:MAG: MarR family transcriptional regulator [Gammaproteobacteria bacterium]|nr:MarR family transcriptional regulator [Gammaproteobacteria bacterium]